MYRYILLDLDGTLTDSKEGIFHALKDAMRPRGREYTEEFMLKFLGPPIMKSLTEFAGFSAEEAEEVKARYRVYYKAVGVYENALIPGTVPLLRRLKDAGKKIALATSKPRSAAEKVLDRFSLTGFFDVVSAAPSDGEDGNKEAVVKAALEKLNVTDDEKRYAVLVGDRKYDCEGALKNGIDAAGFTAAGYAEAGELEAAGAKFVTADIEALYGFLTEGV